MGKFSRTKHIIYMWNELVENFICEILVYETCFRYEMEDSPVKIDFTNEVFNSLMEVKKSDQKF